LVDKGHKLRVTLTTPESIAPAETPNDDPLLVDQRTNRPTGNSVSQTRAKEDEDSEEKEADEAENREAESEETEEKGTMELTYRTVKNGDICEATSQNVEQLNCGNAEESQVKIEAVVGSDSSESNEQRGMTEEPRQVEVRDYGPMTDENEIGPNAIKSLNVGVVNTMALSCDVTKSEDQLNFIPQSEDHPEIRGQPDDTVQTQGSQSQSHTVGNIPDIETHPLQPDETRSDLPSSQLDAMTSERNESSSARHVGHAKFFPDAETSQVSVENSRDEGEMIPVLNMQGNTAEEYRILNVEELVRVDTLPVWSQQQPNALEYEPPTTANDHTKSPTEHELQTSVYTGLDTLYEESSSRIADNPMRSPTFAHEELHQDTNHEGMFSVPEDCQVGREVAETTVGPRRRKTLIDVESQTEIVFKGDKPGNPGVISESTQSTTDPQVIAEHPFNSCTVVNCLVCATIGKNISSKNNLKPRWLCQNILLNSAELV